MSKPTWFKPAFERLDLREYKIGEMVKVHKDFRPKNDTYMDLDYHYYIVFDDGRDIKPCTEVETVLYYKCSNLIKS